MPEDQLTYKDAGVDIEANNEANERIKNHVKRTHNARVITKTGLFGGGLSLDDFKDLKNPVLVGALGHYEGTSLSKEALAHAVARTAYENIPAGITPVAFLDYVAAVTLKPVETEKIVKGFADTLTADQPIIPLIGGETAEMPGVFKKNTWEVVGAMYGISEKEHIAHKSAVNLSMIKA
jgi:phosphoribosylformylglycinamidine cyclo-ligase